MAKKRKGSKKSGRKVRVDLRKNREKTVREKSELTRRFREGDIKQEDAAATESVRAKGQLSRKRTVVLQDETTGDTGLRQGVVVAMRGRIAEVDDGERPWACTVRRLLRTRLIKERHPITVGDAVHFLPVADGGASLSNGERHGSNKLTHATPGHGSDELTPATGRVVSDGQELPEGVIEAVAERETVLVRRYDQRVQVVAANVDLAVIVMAADQPTLRPHLIDRYLIAAHKGGMRPAVCINKMDLDADGFAALVVGRYANLGYSSLLTCALDGRGLDALRDLLTGQTSVLVGPSGVGKSCLLNAMDPDLALKVGTLTELRRGRHTTTTARLMPWAFGGYVVDTPGLRQFELAEIEPEELEAYFVEFVDMIRECRFADCSHTHETGCAVKAAVETGKILSNRYESYCKMYEECREKPKY